MSATKSKDFTIKTDVNGEATVVELTEQTDLLRALKMSINVQDSILIELKKQTRILQKIYNPI